MIWMVLSLQERKFGCAGQRMEVGEKRGKSNEVFVEGSEDEVSCGQLMTLTMARRSWGRSSPSCQWVHATEVLLGDVCLCLANTMGGRCGRKKGGHQEPCVDRCWFCGGMEKALSYLQHGARSCEKGVSSPCSWSFTFTRPSSLFLIVPVSPNSVKFQFSSSSPQNLRKPREARRIFQRLSKVGSITIYTNMPSQSLIAIPIKAGPDLV